MLEKKTRPGFVPEAEQPYPIPQNWRWVRLGGITTIVGGGTPSTKNKAYYENGDIPWISPADLSNYSERYISHGAKNISRLGLEKSSAQLLPANTVCLSTRAPIGYVVIARNPLSTNQGFKSFLPSPTYLPEYLYWYLKGNKDFLESRASGTTFLELSGRKAANIEFPLPPLAEQERIVERIEGLFAKLDAARENAQAVVDAFETRKAAILYRAFSGELTAGWREIHNLGLSDWRKLLLRDIGEIVTGSTPNTKEKAFYGGSVPFIKPAELNQGRHVARSADTLTDAGKALSRPVRAGATCICCIGSIGKCGMLDMDAVTNQQINSVVPYDFMDDVYVYYYCCSNGFKNALIANSCATTISIINKRKTGLLPIVVPPKAEQQEIARILDGLFEAEGQGKQAAELVIEQIDAMKKVVLGRAFRGELGTNRPGEPPCDIVRTETEGDSI